VASTADIEKVLVDMRSAIDAGKFQPVLRKKNSDTLARLGITWDDAKAEVYALSARDYTQGPEADRDRTGTDSFWMFKKNVEGQVIYIKFKVLYHHDGSIRLVSFHIDNM